MHPKAADAGGRPVSNLTGALHKAPQVNSLHEALHMSFIKTTNKTQNNKNFLLISHRRCVRHLLIDAQLVGFDGVAPPLAVYLGLELRVAGSMPLVQASPPEAVPRHVHGNQEVHLLLSQLERHLLRPHERVLDDIAHASLLQLIVAQLTQLLVPSRKHHVLVSPSSLPQCCDVPSHHTSNVKPRLRHRRESDNRPLFVLVRL
jgi:hypothetical protein